MGGPIHGRAYTREGLYMGGPIHGRAYTWEGLYNVHVGP